MTSIKNNITYTKKSFKFIWEYKKSYLLLSFTSIIITTLKPFPSMFLVSNVLTLLSNRSSLHQYLTYISILILIMLFLELLHYLITQKLELQSQQLLIQIKNKFSIACITIDYEKLSRKELLEKKEKALYALEQGSLNKGIHYISSILSNIFILFGMISIAFRMNVAILIPFVLSIFLQLLSDYYDNKRGYVMANEDRPTWRRLYYIFSIASDFSYAKEIRLFSLRDKLNNKLKKVTQKSYQLGKKMYGYSMILGIISEIASFVLEVAIYIILGYQVIVLKILNIGQFSLIANAVREIQSKTSQTINSILESFINADYLKDFFDFQNLCEESTIQETHSKDISFIPFESLVFENVFFAYPESETYALKDVSITIKKNQHIMVVGENGAGKSTFIKLILGLYKPTKGRILYNGIDINTIPYETYLRSFSTVFQDFQLFSFSILENITALQADYNKAIIDKILTKLDLSHKIISLDHKENTILFRTFDESGVELSGGEQQKLAIARALYKDSPFVIFDEPNSALDAKAERNFFENIMLLSKDRTSIIISHRLMSAKHADSILVFSDGSIKEKGSHEELMNIHNGIYQQLYHMQSYYYASEQ